MTTITLTTSCTCETYDEDTDTYSPAEYCSGCWDEVKQVWDADILQPWLNAHNISNDSPIRLEGVGMGWQRRSGYADTTPSQMLDTLAFGNDYALRFHLDDDHALTIVRTSHDEPTGASFVIQILEGED
jgi:hypothetical protein